MKLSEKFKTIGEFELVLDSAEHNASSEFEMEFVASIKEKYDQFGMNMFFSEKQEEVLDRIAYKERR